MSYGLEFLTVKLDSLRNFFASGDDAVCQAVIEKGAEIYEGDENDEEMKEARFVWEEIINSLSGGNLGKYLAEQKSFGASASGGDRVSQMKSLAIASIIRQHGQAVAGVFHSSSSGELFRNETFIYLKQQGFLGGIDPFFLLERPLFNQIPHSFPCWGGLTHAELKSISADKLSSAGADSGDTDVDSWTNSILSLTEECKSRELDLITLYE